MKAQTEFENHLFTDESSENLILILGEKRFDMDGKIFWENLFFCLLEMGVFKETFMEKRYKLIVKFFLTIGILLEGCSYFPNTRKNNSYEYKEDTISCVNPIEPKIMFNSVLRMEDYKYEGRIFVPFALTIDTIIGETIRVKDVRIACMYNKVTPDSILKKDSVLQEKVKDWLLNNIYTTKDSIRGTMVFGTGVVMKH